MKFIASILLCIGLLSPAWALDLPALQGRVNGQSLSGKRKIEQEYKDISHTGPLRNLINRKNFLMGHGKSGKI